MSYGTSPAAGCAGCGCAGSDTSTARQCAGSVRGKSTHSSILGALWWYQQQATRDQQHITRIYLLLFQGVWSTAQTTGENKQGVGLGTGWLWGPHCDVAVEQIWETLGTQTLWHLQSSPSFMPPFRYSCLHTLRAGLWLLPSFSCHHLQVIPSPARQGLVLNGQSTLFDALDLELRPSGPASAERRCQQQNCSVARGGSEASPSGCRPGQCPAAACLTARSLRSPCTTLHPRR